MHVSETFASPFQREDTHFEPMPPTSPALLAHLRKIAESPGVLNPLQKIIWTSHGTVLNRSYNSTNRA
jgi:hypothetical protein